MTTALIRPETPADLPHVHEVVSRAFAAEPVVADLLQELRRSWAWADLSLVAELDGAVVGHVSLTTALMDAPDRLVRVLVLSPLSVAPHAQGAGIGGALVRAAIEAAEQAGAPALFLEGDPAYYGRFGFRPGAEFGFGRPSVRIPEPAFQVIVFDGHDGAAGTLVYPDVFWRFDAVGLREPIDG